MTKEQINNLITDGQFPEETAMRELVETHISWVILCDTFVYKIKKPVDYSFLNFSTLELRKYYCEREIFLNRRLTPDVYLEVLPIREHNHKINIGNVEGTIIDYVLKMNKLDTSKQMDTLLKEDKVSVTDIRNLAEKIASFHQGAEIMHELDLMDIREKFNDLNSVKEIITDQSGEAYGKMIQEAIEFSDRFIEENTQLMADRLKAGLYRDCHGDLHARNIFLLPEPMPFDCIEFNDELRQIDVLNEVAFLCMDLDAFDRKDLSEEFLNHYSQFFPAMKSPEERALFIYYKMYRANIRAKVNGLRVISAASGDERTTALNTAEKYLTQMSHYMQEIQTKE